MILAKFHPKQMHLRLRRLLSSLHGSESGATMTEFVITLPVYLIFFSGILSLFNLQQSILFSHQKAATEMWDHAVDIQEGYQLMHMQPMLAIPELLSYHSEVGTNPLVAIAGDGPNLFGMQMDSGLKAGAINVIPGIDVSPEPTGQPEMMIESVIGAKECHAFSLMNDNMLASEFPSGGGFSEIVGSVLDVAGVRPSIAAGIRYGIATGIDYDSYNVYGMNHSEAKAHYHVTAPTMPQGRWKAVVLTRLELGRTDVYKDMMNFRISRFSSPETSTCKPSDPPGDPVSTPNPDDIAGDVDDDACLQELEAFEACGDSQCKPLSTCRNNHCNKDSDGNVINNFDCAIKCGSETRCGEQICGGVPDCASGSSQAGDLMDCLENQGPDGNPDDCL